MEGNQTLATVEELLAELGSTRCNHARDQLLDELPQIVEFANSEEELLRQLAQCIKRHTNVAAVIHYDYGKSQLSSGRIKRLDDEESLDSQAERAVIEICAQACETCTTEIRSTAEGIPVPVVAAPVISGQRTVEAFGALLGPETSLQPARIAEILQLATAQISVWKAWRTASLAEREARASAALLELVGQLESSEDLSAGCLALVNGLQSFLNCQRVAVGVSGRTSRHCHLQALSGFSRFDKHAEVVTAVEAAMDETLLLEEVIAWPPEEESQRLPARTHEQLLAVLGADLVLSVPLYDAQGEGAGACLIVNPRVEDLAATRNFLQAAQQQLGIALRWLQSCRGGPLFRVRRRVLKLVGPRKLPAAVLAVVISAALLAWPRPHKIACECQLQPIVRRFVAAPYDGTLETTLVQPGDVVAEGDVLAQMDGRETRLELSTLEAEYAQARKAWEVSLSKNDIHEAQQAKLEMKRLELKMEQLRRQQQNLQIRAPLRGIVVSGDLKKSEGAPLTVGQTLFEIAPLEAMKVEVIIPEEEIAYVQPGMETRIRLDAFPRQSLSARINHIVPRAQARDEQFVFIAEAELENFEEMLRPGMNGRAALVGPRRCLGWLLLHKPYESLLMLLGW